MTVMNGAVWVAVVGLCGGATAMAANPVNRPARMAVCDPSAPEQAWDLRVPNGWDQANTLENLKLSPGMCLDVADRSTGDHVPVRAWGCCCLGKLPCGQCGDNTDNFNQIYGLSGNDVITGPKMGGRCLVAVDGAVAGSMIETETCSEAAAGTKVVWVADAPHLRLESNNSLCLETAKHTGPLPPPPPSPPGFPPVPQACTLPNSSSFPFCDATKSIDDRIMNLLSLMEPSEKLTQLIGGIGGGITPAIPRLGIPPYQYHSEGLHGIRDSCRIQKDLFSSLFPQVTAMAATGNLTLIKLMASHMGDEARAVNNYVKGNTFGIGGGLNYWGPTMNIGRDPRWGRFQESVSEDPWLNGAYAAQFVRGFQGDDGVDYTKAAACCKHFYAYSLERSDGYSRHTFNAIVNPQDLAETYNPPFAMCVDAKPEQIMCSYNEVNGVPTCFDDKAQNGFLRDQLGFDGVIFSDCDAVGDGYSTHHYVNSAPAAAAAGIKAGCDVDCGSTYNSSNLLTALNSGILNMSDIDVALGRAMRMRMRAGMFDDPSKVPYKTYNISLMNNVYGQQLALDAARQAVVLLQNVDDMLPLNKWIKSGMTVAIIGPTGNATEVLQGGKSDYCPENPVSFCAGMQAKLTPMSIHVECDDGSDVKKAVQLASTADVVFGAVGGVLGHEGVDRTNISLPADQLTLVDTIHQAGKAKFALVLQNGEPVALDRFGTSFTIVEAMEGGQSGGTALAEILYGDISPSGVLPWTNYPDSFINAVNMSDMSMRPSATSPGRTYRFYNGPTTFPFGFGLSYTKWQLSWDSQTIPKSSMSVSELMFGVNITVDVVNAGSMDSGKVVQLYLSSNVPNTPKRALVAMEKVFVAAGSTEKVQLQTAKYGGYCAFCIVDKNGNSSIPAGSVFTLTVGDGRNEYFAGINITAMQI